jgi:hypothetical protein
MAGKEGILTGEPTQSAIFNTGETPADTNIQGVTIGGTNIKYLPEGPQRCPRLGQVTLQLANR